MKKENFFNGRDSYMNHILYDSLLNELEVQAIEPYYERNLAGVGRLFTNDPRYIYLCDKIEFDRNDALSQMSITYTCPNGVLTTLLANLVQPNFYMNTVLREFTIIKYITNIQNVDSYEFIGWLLTLKT